MTEKLLSKQDCARCRQCCAFESYGLRSTPIITDDLAVKAKMIKPDIRFAKPDGIRLFMMEREEDIDLYYCPMLDRETGCMLGDDKPFECQIFPYSLMRLGGKLVIAVSAYCPMIKQKTLIELRTTAAELAPVVFAEGEKRPELVRPFENGYVILMTK